MEVELLFVLFFTAEMLRYMYYARPLHMWFTLCQMSHQKTHNYILCASRNFPHPIKSKNYSKQASQCGSAYAWPIVNAKEYIATKYYIAVGRE